MKQVGAVQTSYDRQHLLHTKNGGNENRKENCERTTFTQIPRRAVARMQHRSMVRCAADAAEQYCMVCVAPGSALCRGCKCKWNAHAQSRCMCTCVLYVHGATLRMCPVRPPGCRLCGAYAVAVAVGVITHQLAVACSACAWAL